MATGMGGTPMRPMARTEEITALDPPTSWAVSAGGGPGTTIARGSIEPLEDGRRARVTLALDFRGHGFGTLLAHLFGRGVRKQLPKNMQALKQRLERRA